MAVLIAAAAAAVWLTRTSTLPLPWRTGAVVSSSPQPAAAAKRPADVHPRLAEAAQALARKDYVAALHLADAAEMQGAPVWAVEETRASVFRETEYLDREIETYQRWAAAAPDDAEPWLKLFYIYSDLSWKREADWASSEALKRAPQESRAHIARALFLEQNKRVDEALAELDTADRLNTGNAARIANIRATFLIRGEKGKEAEAAIQPAIQQEPSQLTHRVVLAQALLTQNRLDDAAAVFREVQRQDPGSIEASFQLGIIAEKRGDLTEATQQMERAAKIDAQYGTVLWNLVQLYRRQGRVAESKSLAKLYGTMNRSTSGFENKIAQLETRPGDLKLHWQIALNYLESGEYAKAIVELRAVQQFAPKDPLILRGLQIALTKSGRETEAQAVKQVMQEATVSKKKKP